MFGSETTIGSGKNVNCHKSSSFGLFCVISSQFAFSLEGFIVVLNLTLSTSFVIHHFELSFGSSNHCVSFASFVWARHATLVKRSLYHCTRALVGRSVE